MDDSMEDDEKLELSGSALAALQEFFTEKDQQEQRFVDLKAAAESNDPNVKWSMDMFTEDWNASQFWYSDETATLLAQELLKGATSDTHLAIISAPSVFVQLKNLLASDDLPMSKPKISLFEYDDRFNTFPEFVKYDFKRPLELAQNMKGQFDRVICDPPFLSSDCQTKAAMTVRWLAKASKSERPTLNASIMICTGGMMELIIHKLYPGIRTTTFEPRHAQDRLSNDFRCYANFESDRWSFR